MIPSPLSSRTRISSVASAFDALAPDYDSLWTNGLAGRLQRQQVWRVVLSLFRPGDRVLELGCGAGTDAACLARAGIRVHATDVSPEMLRAAWAKIDREGLSGMVTFELLSAEQLSELEERGPFDGAFSNFGALNCVQDLRLAAAGLERLVRPEGKVALCFMGRFCAWETAWFLLHGRPRKAFRRLLAGRTGTEASLAPGARLRVFYPSVSELRRAFRRDFDLESSRSIGVLVPPSCAQRWAGSRPEVFDKLSRIDEYLGPWPVLRGAGDHRLAVFVRKGSSIRGN